MLGDTASDDELAFLVGHEMSHNILGHRARLDEEGVGRGVFSAYGKNAAAIRRTEEEADYLGLYLVASAGYDPAAAATFWQRFSQAHGMGIFADSTHLNGQQRVRYLRLAAAEIARKRVANLPLTPDMTGIAALDAQAKDRGKNDD